MMKKQVEYLQRLFYDVWNDFGSVYLLVKYSDKTVIGKRGFTDEEKKKGLVLVFNNKTSTKLNWDEDGNLSCVLAFGARREDVSIHHDDLLGVFSPEAGVQLVRSDIGKEKEAEQTPEPEAKHGDSRQVVSLSAFRKHKPTGHM
jgi:hypothetical protein